MKKTLLAIATCSLPLLALAGNPAPSNIGPLVGHWSTPKAQTLNAKNQFGSIMYTVDIMQQNGNFISGRLNWSSLNKEQKYHVKSKPFSKTSEPFIGIVNSHNGSIIMVETSEDSKLFANLTSKNKMHITYVESGDHAVVMQADLTKG